MKKETKVTDTKLSEDQILRIVLKALNKSMSELMNKADDHDTEMYMEYLFHQLLAAGLKKKHGEERFQNYIAELIEKESVTHTDKTNLH